MNVRALSPPAKPDQRLIADTLQTKLPFRADLAKVVPLAGDASNRRYFRLELTGGSVPSVILMQLADPEGFKASEEAVSGSAFEVTELPFVNVLRHLSSAGVAVPTLHYYDEVTGLLYLEDFGDVALVHACADKNGAAILELYSRAIDTLVHIHLRATGFGRQTCLAFTRSCDVPLLMWEFDHFLEYGVVARRGKPMEVDDEKSVRREFQKIAELLAAQPQVFTHRDYHSRNLMVDGDRLGVIDFQDALLGPPTYDLASLLRDSYLGLDEAVIDSMIDRYVEEMCKGLDRSTRQRMEMTNPVAFRRLFDFTSIQRNLKAAGRFVYIERVKHNPKFLADIPRTLGYVRRNLEKYPELEALRTHLMPYVPEWQ